MRGAGDETRTRDVFLGKVDKNKSRVANSGSRSNLRVSREKNHFINPHRLFHGMWLPQWLEDRPEVSEKAKKLYSHLTYFAGGKGCAWPTFNTLAGKLHVSRRHVIRLVKELSLHRLISVTNVSCPERGSCANHYRFLWHPWMQMPEDEDLQMAACDDGASPQGFADGDDEPGDVPIALGGGDTVTPRVASASPAPVTHVSLPW